MKQNAQTVGALSLKAESVDAACNLTLDRETTLDMDIDVFQLEKRFELKLARSCTSSAVGERGCDENFVARRGARG
jgi:hypothetical protein